MQNHIHTQETHSGVEDAGGGAALEQNVPCRGSAPDFPEVRWSFSLSGMLLLALTGYKKFISPWLPRCCRFTPTCSAYAAEAVMVHGPFKGALLTLRRLLRCQPFCRGGYDPVPPRKSPPEPPKRQEK